MREKRKRARAQEIINAAKAGGCVQCGEQTLCCLDLHHLDPSTKRVKVNKAIKHFGIKGLLVEIGKCVVLCANCHRKHHAGEFLRHPRGIEVSPNQLSLIEAPRAL